MAHLQVERTIAESGAALDAFGTADAAGLINGVFIIGHLNIGALDRVGGTELDFGLGPGFGIGPQIGKTEITVSAQSIGMHAFNRRRHEHAFGFAASALGAFVGIDLPDLFGTVGFSGIGRKTCCQPAGRQTGARTRAETQEVAAIDFLFFIHGKAYGQRLEVGG